MNRKKIFGWILIVTTVCLCLAEILLRWPGHADVRFKLADKRLHCLDSGGRRVRLCPGARVDFVSPFGFAYTVTTDINGERTTYPDGTPPAEAPEIWIIGDSIAMGYGLDDRDTFAALLARRRSDLRVRNLGVDALGAGGTLAILLDGLERASRSGTNPPAHVFWIMHMSDFIDDPADEVLAASSARLALRRAHFFASRHSAVYNLLKHWSEQGRLSQRANVYTERAEVPAQSHPTLRHIAAAITLAREREIPLSFVFYPNVDHATGRTGSDYRLERFLTRFIQERGGTTIDTRPPFLAADRDDLYLPVDGHPAPEGAKIFAKVLEPFFPRPRQTGH